MIMTITEKLAKWTRFCLQVALGFLPNPHATLLQLLATLSTAVGFPLVIKSR